MNNSLKGIVRSILAISVVIILGCLLAIYITRYQKNLDKELSEDPYQLSSFEYDLDNYDYTMLLEKAKKNKLIDEKPYESVDQYIAFAYFYEAATYYRLYQGNDETKAQEYEKKAYAYLSQITSNHFYEHIQNVKDFFIPNLADDTTMN